MKVSAFLWKCSVAELERFRHSMAIDSSRPFYSVENAHAHYIWPHRENRQAHDRCAHKVHFTMHVFVRCQSKHVEFTSTHRTCTLPALSISVYSQVRGRVICAEVLHFSAFHLRLFVVVYKVVIVCLSNMSWYTCVPNFIVIGRSIEELEAQT